MRLTLRPYGSKYDQGLWHGVESTQPDEVAHSLQIWFDGGEVGFGRGMFGDLSRVNELELRHTMEGMQVFIGGGDAHGSYRAYIWLDEGGCPTRRRLEHGEFPEN